MKYHASLLSGAAVLGSAVGMLFIRPYNTDRLITRNC